MAQVFNISSNLSFLDSLAQGVLEKFPDLQNLTIFLPTKRAIRPLAEAFLKHSKNKKHSKIHITSDKIKYGKNLILLSAILEPK